MENYWKRINKSPERPSPSKLPWSALLLSQTLPGILFCLFVFFFCNCTITILLTEWVHLLGSKGVLHELPHWLPEHVLPHKKVTSLSKLLRCGPTCSGVKMERVPTSSILLLCTLEGRNTCSPPSWSGAQIKGSDNCGPNLWIVGLLSDHIGGGQGPGGEGESGAERGGDGGEHGGGGQEERGWSKGREDKKMEKCRNKGVLVAVHKVTTGQRLPSAKAWHPRNCTQHWMHSTHKTC